MKPLSLSKISNSNIENNNLNKHQNLIKKSLVIKIIQNDFNNLQNPNKTKFKTSKNSPDKKMERNSSEEPNVLVKALNNNLNNVKNNPVMSNNKTQSKNLLRQKPEINQFEYFKSKLGKNKKNFDNDCNSVMDKVAPNTSTIQ